MTDTTKRAELLAIADQIDVYAKHGTNAIFEQDDAKKIAIALRHLASQDQKPVAWGRVVGGMAVTVSRERTPANDEPLYTSPPPAAGWDEAIDAACKICSFAIDQTHNMSRMAMAEELRDAIEALRHNAPPDTGASAEARLREQQYVVEGIILRRLFKKRIEGYTIETAKEIVEALSAHPHASDCDKQGCMGDASPCDPKDLAELLSKPSVLEPSDRTADVTVDELAMKIAKARIHSRKSTYIARALLDAFTVGRR